MKYRLLKELLQELEKFETFNEQNKSFTTDLNGFKNWIIHNQIANKNEVYETDWEGKSKGRSPESIINTLIVHMNRYAKIYSKAAIYGSDFSTQEEFIFLIVLRSVGPMTKMELIKKNVMEKPAGMKLIDRLIANNWVNQKDSLTDKRSKLIQITEDGIKALDNQMDKIRQASKIVTGNLTEIEKNQLINLLTKLEVFHQDIHKQNIGLENLLSHLAN